MGNFATGNKLLNPKDILGHIGLDTGMRVGDLGCGNGYFVFTAAEMVGGRGQVYAVDVLKSCLQTVARESERQQLLNVKPIWSNIEILGATGVPDESLDVVLIVHALYQSTDKKSFLREAGRLLKSGGKVLIVDWKKLETPLGPPVEQRISLDELKKMISTTGQFQELEEFTPGEYHYALLLEKK